MGLETSHIIQLLIALGGGIAVFGIAYVIPERLLVKLLIVLVPFQVVNSQYGSLNMVLTYLIFAALFLKRKLVHYPFAGSIFVILLAYFLSFSQVHPSTFKDHLDYILVVSSNFLLFFIVYNFINTEKDLQDLIKILLIVNIMVGLYCTMQLAIGFERYSFFGIEELTIMENRQDHRLMGPFNAVDITAEYFAIQCIICSYLLVYQRRKAKRIFLIALILANFGFIVASGTRGGLVSLAIGVMLFGYVYRRKLGVLRLITGGGAIVLGFLFMGFLTIEYTEFNVFQKRVVGTTLKEGLPDSRSVVWRSGWEAGMEKPILGHGPRLRLINEDKRKIPGHRKLDYPHSSYLFLWNTIGIVGILAYFMFFTMVFLRLRQGLDGRSDNNFVNGFIKLGIIILTVFVIDQTKIAFLRFMLHDYQQYIFAVCAIFIATADKIKCEIV